MKDTIRLITGLLLLAAITLPSCGPRKVSKTRLVSLIEHSKELNQTQEINGIKVQLKYCPYQLLISQELDNSKGDPKDPDTARLSALEKKYSGQYYFRLSYSKNNKEVIRQLGDFHRYSDMLQVFSFELGGFINASTEKNDTLSLKDYAFEQDYGMGSANTSLLVFNKNDFRDINTITVNIGEFGLGIGSMRFNFRQNELTGLPALSYAAN
jgi:hypothetical protein